MNKAFTLIELLSVIAILAIILFIAVPKVLDTISSSKKAAFKANAQMILKEIEYKTLNDKTFDPTIITQNNVESILDIDDSNYSLIVVKKNNNRIYLLALGQKDWKDLGVISNSFDIEFFTTLNLWYDFSGKSNIDSNKGTITDRTNITGDGTLNGFDYTITSGWNENYLTFDGSNDNISIPTISTGNANWTISVWMKTSATDFRFILTNSNGGPVSNGLCINKSTITYYHYYGSWISNYGNINIADGKWHLLTWVNYSNQTMAMYVDGEIDGSTFSSTINNTGPLNIIGKNWGSTYFQGSISDIKVFKESLSSAQIKNIYEVEKYLLQ